MLNVSVWPTSESLAARAAPKSAPTALFSATDRVWSAITGGALLSEIWTVTVVVADSADADG